VREFLSNTAHLHVVLNHVPTIGFLVGLAIFLIGLARRHDGLKRTGLTIFFVVANVSIATYVTGVGAEALIKDRPDVSGAAIRAHEDAALLAFTLMEITGFFAWLALWQWRRIPRRPPRWTMPVVLLLSVATFALMANAANLGGEISHAEIRSASAAAATPAPDGEATGVAQSLGMFVAGETWVWPACETIHFIGLCLLFGVVLIVDLRMLGMVKSVSYAAVFQLLPLGMLGFGLNLITGMLFFMGNPGQYIHNVMFFWKIVLVMLGGFNVLYFTLDHEPWELGPGDDAPLTAKIAAVSAMFLWVAVLFCGHMLPFLGDAF
jgi:uncharacterized membrane protein